MLSVFERMHVPVWDGVFLLLSFEHFQLGNSQG